MFRALLAHPLIGQHDLADKLTDLLISRQSRSPAVGGVTAAVLAIDGGNSKTDVCLISADGHAPRVRARAGLQPPEHRYRRRIRCACRAWSAEAAPRLESMLARRSLEQAAVYLAGADFPGEVDMLRRARLARRLGSEVSLDNDTFALLRAGTSAANRIAVVCGAGINCVGVSAAGGLVRFPSVGVISGDWGGGGSLGPRRSSLRCGPRTAVASPPRCARRSWNTSARHPSWT